MNWAERTIQTYNQSAAGLAKHFREIGPKVVDIERGLDLAKVRSGARVIEIGCGDGRDAQEIIKRVAWYEGFDPSEGLLSIARSTIPNSSLMLANALTYTYPKNLDVVYAFASLLHVNKNDLGKVCKKVALALRPNGIFYIYLKERDTYTEEVKKDIYGERMFFYYNTKLVQDLAGKSFETVYESHYIIGHTNWFTMALKKSMVVK